MEFPLYLTFSKYCICSVATVVSPCQYNFSSSVGVDKDYLYKVITYFKSSTIYSTLTKILDSIEMVASSFNALPLCRVGILA